MWCNRLVAETSSGCLLAGSGLGGRGLSVLFHAVEYLSKKAILIVPTYPVPV